MPITYSGAKMWRAPRRTWTGLLGLCVLCCCLVAPTKAQQPDTTSLASFAALNNIPEALLAEVLGDPATINKILQRELAKGPALLRNLNVSFKTFKAADTDSITGLGLAYSFARNITDNQFSSKGATQAGFSLSLQAQGDVAFERALNPNDFLDAGLRIHAYRSAGGAVLVTDSVATLLNELETQQALIEDPEELASSPFAARFTRIVRDNLTPQLYTEAALSAHIESDQRFDQTQYVYGVHLGVDFKPWNAGYWNLADWPFAVLRWLTGYDRALAPTGATFPTLLVGVQLVDPQGVTLRESLGETAPYPRFSTEIGFKTRAAPDLSFLANFRYYREIDAPASIRAADLAEQLYFTAALVTSTGLFASYTVGKLPFDRMSDQVYALGFKFGF